LSWGPWLPRSNFQDMRRSRIKPHHISIGVGVAMTLLIIASYVSASIEGWDDSSPVSRPVFGNIPDPLKAIFYSVLPVLVLAGAWLFAQRIRNWERGQPDDRSTNPRNAKRRVKAFRSGVYMQTLLRDPAAGIMHSLIYFGFIGLFAVTVISQIQEQLPESWKFLHGTTYQGYGAFADAVGVMFTVGVVWAIARRYVVRPYRIRSKTRPEDHVI